MCSNTSKQGKKRKPRETRNANFKQRLHMRHEDNNRQFGIIFAKEKNEDPF